MSADRELKTMLQKIRQRVSLLERGQGRGAAPGETANRTFPTNAKMQAWTPRDGSLAWVTAENRGYVRSGGAWRFQNPTIGGKSNLPVTASGVDLFVRLPFTSGRFVVPPAVVVTPNAAFVIAANWFVSVTTVTPSYADIAYRRTGGTAASLDVMWIATAAN